MKMGNDGEGKLLSLDSQEPIWVNEKMLFALVSSVVVFLEMVLEKKENNQNEIADIIATIAEGIYDKIEDRTPSSQPEGL